MTPQQLVHARKRIFGETQAVFAERTGVSARTLVRYESGESPIPLIVGLAIAARIYGLPPWGFDLSDVYRGERSGRDG